jgi:hypothetical protein
VALAIRVYVQVGGVVRFSPGPPVACLLSPECRPWVNGVIYRGVSSENPSGCPTRRIHCFGSLVETERGSPEEVRSQEAPPAYMKLINRYSIQFNGHDLPV